MQDDKRTPVGFFPRLAAYGIDRLLLVIALLLVRIPAWIVKLATGIGGNVLFRFTAADVICYVLSALYFILLTYFTGGTLGKKLMRIHVEKEDGSAPGAVDIIYRETVGRYLGELVLFIGYLMVLADRENRAFHDWLCGTRVVYDDGVSIRPRKRSVPMPVLNSDYSVPDASVHEMPITSDAGYTVPGTEREKIERDRNPEDLHSDSQDDIIEQ